MRLAPMCRFEHYDGWDIRVHFPVVGETSHEHAFFSTSPHIGKIPAVHFLKDENIRLARDFDSAIVPPDS